MVERGGGMGSCGHNHHDNRPWGSKGDPAVHASVYSKVQVVETMTNPAPYDVYVALCLPRQSSNEGSFNLSTQVGPSVDTQIEGGRGKRSLLCRPTLGCLATYIAY
jgi:hypothetical protein